MWASQLASQVLANELQLQLQTEIRLRLIQAKQAIVGRLEAIS
jgi:hypothetical protein